MFHARVQLHQALWFLISNQVWSGSDQPLQTLLQVVEHHLWYLNSLERMAFFWFLYSLDDRLVDPEADGDRQESQDEVRNHTDDAESCQGQQRDQRGAKDKASLLHITPENQVVHCQEKRSSR